MTATELRSLADLRAHLIKRPGTTAREQRAAAAKVARIDRMLETPETTVKPSFIGALETVEDPRSKLVELLNSISSSTSHKLAGVVGATAAEEFGTYVQAHPLELPTDVETVYMALGYTETYVAKTETTLQWALELLERRQLRTLEAEWRALGTKTENRVRYLPQPLSQYNGRWRHDPDGRSDLRAKGLMTLATEHRFGPQSEPVCMGVLNTQPMVLNDKDQEEQPEVPISAWLAIQGAGVTVSGERLAWNRHSPAWPWLLKTFPLAKDFAAYNHSLNSPVIPEGFFPEIDIQLGVIKGVNELGELVDLQRDGSCLYNVKHPVWKKFVAKYGRVVFQFRYIDAAGVFCKGIAVPSTQLDDDCAILCDWIQVKGAHKALAATRRDEDATATRTGYLGIMKVFNRPRRLNFCFEGLENLKVNATTVRIVQEQLDSRFSAFAEGGKETILADIGKKDRWVRMALQMCARLTQLGHKVDPLQIPRIAALYDEKLGKRLYKIVNSGGLTFPRLVCVLDSRLRKGEVVIWDKEPGITSANFRFPMVLAQGLTTTTTVEPYADMLVGGKLPPYTVFMSHEDLVTCMQGDDDGDESGVSTDPTHVELWSHIDCTDIYHIEPKGIPVLDSDGEPLAANHTEGWDFILRDQRGPVGSCTNARRDLKAIQAHAAANAVSVGIQEAVDKQKRLPQWSDYRELQHLSRWHKDEAGEYHVRAPGSDDNLLPEDLCAGDELDTDSLWEWVGEFKSAAGLSPKANVTGWAWPGKRIIPSQWEDTATRQMYKGSVGFTGGNLVHIAHDHGLVLWREVEEIFDVPTTKYTMEHLVPDLLSTEGWYIDCNMSWMTYKRTLRKTSGFNQFGREFNKLINGNITDQVRYQRIDQITQDLEGKLRNLTEPEIAQIWYMEMTPTYRHQEQNKTWFSHVDNGTRPVNNPNNAWRAISWNGSPVLTALGITEEEECGFLTPGRINKIMEIAFNTSDAIGTVHNLIKTSKTHKKSTGVHGWACPHCVDTLNNEVVRRIREDRGHMQHQWIKTITEKSNGTYGATYPKK